ncbi:hypothetical protein BDW02DRAFT_581367 [Decorospora gaudefroyi]|uniref:Mid2 domain-containing protein n=1 Tax=Decorospora gaudefroyi TaxID=184978 RepID=A0A6A5KAZ0_9PLEO|nr:hypothetical protein BDW02DRAFT_581367 [Decorospora gaudefroyi]
MPTQIAGRSLSAGAVAVLGFVTFVTAVIPSGSSVSFLYPPAPTAGSLLVNNIDSVYVEWTSNYDDSWLYFYCHTGVDGKTETIFHEPVPESGNSTVGLDGQGALQAFDDWSERLRCWFDLNTEDKPAAGAGQVVVSVTSLAAEATTYSPGAPEASATPSTSPESSTQGASQTDTTVTATSSATPTTSAAPATSADDGLSSGVTAGIVVGAVAGVGALAAIGFFFYRRSRQQRNMRPNMLEMYGNEEKPYGVGVNHGHQGHAAGNYASLHEAPIYEAPAAQPQELYGSVAPLKKTPL